MLQRHALLTPAVEIELFHLEQYKSLREEVMYYVREIYRTEAYGIIAAGAIYTWLVLHKQEVPIRLIWFFPPFLIVLGAIRSLMFVIRISQIGKYLRLLEEVTLGQETKLPGWEMYKPRQRWVDLVDRGLATLAWILLFVATMTVSWLASR